MYQIDNSTVSLARPASTAAGTAGYYTDGNPAGGVAATILPAEWLNAVQDELLNVIKAAGITPDKTKFNQLALALQATRLNYAHDTGAANAYVVTLSPPPAALSDGLSVTFQAANANTAASTLNLNGLGAQPILGGAHQPLRGGEIVAQGDVRVIWNAALAAWVILESTGGIQQAATAPQFNSTTDLATTAFVQRALGNLSRISLYNATVALDVSAYGQFIILGGTSAGQIVTLPAIASAPNGSAITIQQGGATTWTVKTAGSDIITVNVGSVTSLTMGQGSCLTLVNDGGTWRVAGGSAQLQYAAEFSASLAGNGYQKLPSGLIVQWGAVGTSSSGYATWTFPIAFPNNCLSVMGTTFAGTQNSLAISANTLSATSTTIAMFNSSNAFTAGTARCWAIGY